MQGTDSYIPETNHVSRACSVVLTISAINNVTLPLKCVLYFYISIFSSMWTVSNMAVFVNFVLSCYVAQVLSVCF
jgi:hypothetical protein